MKIKIIYLSIYIYKMIMPVSFNADGGASSRFPLTSEHKPVSLNIADIAGRVGYPNAAVAMLKFCWDKI